MSSRAFILCACCQQPGRHHGRGLISRCHYRHTRNGTLEQFPLSRHPAEPWQPIGPHGRRMLDRYRKLAAVRPPLTTAAIAWELGVSERQVHRYAAAIRTTQAATPQTGSEAA
ncbi:hypothetical protein AB0L05_27885 [Nonomuraea pusilla]|uniref:hypothetical protein n=1 Tax=Nonomuraea pusilla TaxID=46177 RepID=UPI00331DA438